MVKKTIIINDIIEYCYKYEYFIVINLTYLFT